MRFLNAHCRCISLEFQILDIYHYGCGKSLKMLNITDKSIWCIHRHMGGTTLWAVNCSIDSKDVVCPLQVKYIQQQHEEKAGKCLCTIASKWKLNFMAQDMAFSACHHLFFPRSQAWEFKSPNQDSRRNWDYRSVLKVCTKRFTPSFQST